MVNDMSDGGTRRRGATRERLLDAARAVLAREGIQGASVEHICEQAGFTRGAFYSNFTSKDELILALFHRERELMLGTLRTAADPASFADKDPAEAIGIIMDRYVMLQPVDREWFLVHAEFELRGVREDAVGREYNDAWRELKDQITRLILTVVDTLGLRLTIDPEHATTIIMGTYDTALREALIENRPLDTALLKETIPLLMLSVTHPVA